MENPTAYIYLILGLGCLYLYRLLKKRWNIQNDKKKTLFKFLFKNLNNKKQITIIFEVNSNEQPEISYEYFRL